MTAYPTTRSVTPSGRWALYYAQRPDELSPNAPDPLRKPAEFAEWAKRNLPEIVRKKECKDG